jgi:hypothetical protein
MEVHFTAEQEAKLRMLAENNGRKAEQLVTELVESFLADEESEIRELRAAIDEADRDLEAGHYSDYNESTLTGLFDGIRRRGAEAPGRDKPLK